jgi:hypothetical protein
MECGAEEREEGMDGTEKGNCTELAVGVATRIQQAANAIACLSRTQR